MQAWEEIASLARLAPTPHNTQPFRILPRGDRADLLLLTERLLPREDHGNRYVVSAFGIFTATLERAARHLGYEIGVEPIATLDPEGLETVGPRILLGEARITGRCPSDPQAELLDVRRTSRLPYHDRAVDAEALRALAAVAARGSHRFVEHGDATVVGPLLQLNAEAIIDNLELDDEREEIRRWTRLGSTPRFGDGLWKGPMNQPAWELWSAFAIPSVFRLPWMRRFAIRRYLATQRGTRHIALLCGPFQRWPDLYAAGRMLQTLWLEMAARNVYMQPMGSMLTNPRYALEIARRFGCDDCWLVFRFGYSDPPPRAPRLERIVLDREGGQ
jgi:nitroreductase